MLVLLSNPPEVVAAVKEGARRARQELDACRMPRSGQVAGAAANKHTSKFLLELAQKHVAVRISPSSDLTL